MNMYQEQTKLSDVLHSISKSHLCILFLLFIKIPLFSQNKTNVILILSDDQGWGDLSLNGNPWLDTPHLDNLAKTGTRFENFYVSPLCAPTRASILTGRYHLRTGVVSVSRGLETMNTDETTLAELFKSNGYKTGIFGKWHNGQHYPNRPNDQGFDEFLGFCSGHLSNYFNTTLDHNGTSVKTEGYITDVLTDAALTFIESNRQKPFFCYIPYNTPHSPHQVPDSYYDKYKAKGLDDELSSIYGMVENLDDNVGRILSYLKRNDLEENTIVIFLSDNGPNGVRYNGNMKGTKGSVHEGGVRVPFFIQWKNHIPEGKVIESPAAHIDLYPTLIELCQLNAPVGKPLDGLSLTTMMFDDEKGELKDRNIFAHVNLMKLPVTLAIGGFRNNQYRFVFNGEESHVYDIIRDAGESNNIARTNKTLMDTLSMEYEQWFAEVTSTVMTERPSILSKAGIELPVYEASLSSGLKFKEGHGWAHDWVEKWDSTEDYMYWEIDCSDSGNYAVELDYLCKKNNTGSVIECAVGEVRKQIVVRDAFYSKQIPSPDRVPRKEAYEMAGWKNLRVGIFPVPKGRSVIKIKALRIKNNNVAEVKGLRIQYVDKQ